MVVFDALAVILEHAPRKWQVRIEDDMKGRRLTIGKFPKGNVWCREDGSMSNEFCGFAVKFLEGGADIEYYFDRHTSMHTLCVIRGEMSQLYEESRNRNKLIMEAFAWTLREIRNQNTEKNK